MALNLTRPKHGSFSKPSVVRLFSTAPPLDNPSPPNSATDGDGDSNQKPQPSFSSYFSDVKTRLKNQQQQQQNKPIFQKPSFTNPPLEIPDSPIKKSCLDDIRKNLSQFRLRPPPSKEPAPQQQQQHQPVSFQEMYKRNVIARSNGAESTGFGGGAKPPSFDSIRESLKQMREKNPRQNVEYRDSMSLSAFKNTLKEKPNNGPGFRLSGSNVLGGTQELPQSIFGKETVKQDVTGDMKTEFVRMYSHSELGKKLGELRVEEEMKKWGEGGGEWSWLEELNERLAKLRNAEEMETQSNIGTASLKNALISLKMAEDAEKDKKVAVQRYRIDFLSQLGQTPTFMKLPAQEHLVEKYFHPDNLSSTEKMKAQLQKVREEFKMSESDCGSARVQVAQLTTKINHLATALHKKDKHSRKGLQEMVVKRKKLLKYLRRIDWDSYCLVLSRLGLRDNPDYKH